MPAGQPTKYRPEMCDVILEHLSLGYSLTAAAGKAGIHKDTAYEYIKKHPQFSDAVKDGRAAGMALWEKRLTTQALKAPGNTAAIIFAMKNLYQDDWRDKVETDHTSSDGSMSPRKLEGDDLNRELERRGLPTAILDE